MENWRRKKKQQNIFGLLIHVVAFLQYLDQIFVWQNAILNKRNEKMFRFYFVTV